MEMHGEYQISADRQTVWDALNEAAVLKACLNGCESFEKNSDSEFAAVITTKVGPIKTTFSCDIELSDIDPPNSYVLLGKGDGGASGYAKGSVNVSLAERDDGTLLSYTVDASLRGKIGQMGSRVIDSVAKAMADDFFDNLARIVSERTGVVADLAPPAKRLQGLLHRTLIIAGIVGLLIIGVIYLIARQ